MFRLRTLIPLAGLIGLAWWQKKQQQQQQRQERNLDQTIEDSFPASDAPSWSGASSGQPPEGL